MKVNIIKTETFSTDTKLDDMNSVLASCIDSFISRDDEIINIQLIERGGAYRFWIYLIEK